MAKKLEGFTKVAVVKMFSQSYHFAIYEDGFDYSVGDYILVTGVTTNQPHKIEEIISAEEAQERFSKSITAEVICKVDISAWEKRVEKRKEKEKLLKEMEKRKKAIQKEIDMMFYAEKDAAFAELMNQYKEMETV